MSNGTVKEEFLDHSRFTPIFEAAQALDVPIYLHPAPPPKAVLDAYYSGLPSPLDFLLSTAGWGWHVETGLHCLRLMLAGIFDRFPKLKIIVGHMGEDLPFRSPARKWCLVPGARPSELTARRVFLGAFLRHHQRLLYRAAVSVRAASGGGRQVAILGGLPVQPKHARERVPRQPGYQSIGPRENRARQCGEAAEALKGLLSCGGRYPASNRHSPRRSFLLPRRNEKLSELN